MEQRRFSSPREEALEIAIQTRKKILESKITSDSVLRACLVIASNLNKKNDIEWIELELAGYKKTTDIPLYRNISCPIYDNNGNFLKKFKETKVHYDVHTLYGVLDAEKQEMSIAIDTQEHASFTVARIKGLLDKITDRCLFFLNNIITELQYGGIIEYLMEEIRKNTDEKLVKLDSKLTDEAQSLFLNLSSTNPADWNKVGHSCRKILQLLADKVFPPKQESYKMKDDRVFEVGESHYINRLCAFLDQKTSGDERKFSIVEIGCLESYLRQIVEYDQMGEHKPSIEKYHANMMAIHTYLIISEIMRHIQSP